jgi:F0F1-type ATP synthase assembly protein I
MFGGTGDRKELARYFTLSQVGLEMVAPIVVGVLLDRWLGTSPWCVAGGAALGLVVGLVHLVKLSNPEGPQAKGDDTKPESRP